MAQLTDTLKKDLTADANTWTRITAEHPDLGNLQTIEEFNAWVVAHNFPLRSEQLWQYKEAATYLSLHPPSPHTPATDQAKKNPFDFLNEFREHTANVGAIDLEQLALKEALKEELPLLGLIPPTIETDDLVAKIRYEQKEQAKTFEDIQEDPFYKQYLEKKKIGVQQEVEKAKQKWEEEGSQGKFPIDVIKNKAEYKYTAAFAKQFPEKAEAYGKDDYRLKVARNHYKQEEAVLKQNLAKGTTTQWKRSHLAQAILHAPGPTQQEQRVITPINKIITRSFLPSQTRSQAEPQVNPSQQQSGPGLLSQGMDMLNNLASKRRIAAQNARRLGRVIGRQSAKSLGSTMTKQGLLTGGRALLLNPYVLAALAIFLLILFVIILIVVILNSSGGSGTGTSATPSIPGLTMTISGPDQVANGQFMTYSIQGNYTGAGEVIITNPIPDNADWADPTGNVLSGRDPIKWTVKAGETFSHTITLKPKNDDSIVINRAEAVEVGGGSFAGPPIEGGSGNACTEPHEGRGHCSVENLKRYFNGDQKKAIIASMICKKESGSNPLALNTNCGTNDYSVGLFQINLVAHCAGAYANQSCRQLIDEQKRNVCELQYRNPEENIKKLLQLSNNGNNWQPWGAYTHSTAGVAIIAQRCGII